jgi:superfamily II DNA or RNA helicase
MIQLRPHQTKGIALARDAFREGHRRVLVVLPTGGGKCLGRGTPVLMFDGTTKAVENVRAGEMLMGPDSAPRRVVTICKGREMLYRVTPTKGDAYVVNEGHVLSVKSTGAGDFPCEAGDVVTNLGVRAWLGSSRTFRHTHKGWRTGVEFAARPLPAELPPYILGLWLGDGAARLPAVTTMDPEIVAELETFAKSIGCRVRKDTSPGCPSYYVTNGIKPGRGIRSNPFKRALHEAGVLNDKHVPQEYRANTRDVRLDVLAGLLDSDGHLSHSGYDFISALEGLADDVCFLARSLGLAAYKTPCRKVCGNNGVEGQYYRVSISGDCSIIPCRLPRKRGAARLQKKSVLVTSIDVSPIGEGEYFGFEIDGPDHLFLLGDFTVTHNTILFCWIAASHVERGGRVLVIVHRRELVTQTVNKMRDAGLARVGVIAAGSRSDPDAPVQIASVQTLIARQKRAGSLLGDDALPPATLVILDEAHHYVAETWGSVATHYADAKILGVTATPERGDGTPLGDLFDTLVPLASVRELVDAGFLVPCDVIGPPRKTRSLSEDPVDAYAKHGGGRKAVVFASSVKDAYELAGRFTMAGFPSACVEGDMAADTRDSTLTRFATGELRVVVNVFVLTEGWDCPSVEVCILARGCSATGTFLQMIGRVLRPSPETQKTRALLIDLRGAVHAHDMPDADREYSLEGKGISEGGEAPLKTCKACLVLVPLSVRVCPACGAEFPKSTWLEEKLGLSKIERADVERTFFVDSLEAAQMRGYKPGWAVHRFVKKFGRFPAKLWKELVKDVVAA